MGAVALWCKHIRHGPKEGEREALAAAVEGRHVEDRYNQTIRLEDGRTLGFAEYGDPAGRPAFYFHGSPSCRLDWSIFGDEAWARSHGVRFIAIDRPGMGLSDYQTDRTLVDWPDDVAELADTRGIETFAVWGFPLEQVATPVHIWHGEADRSTPVAMGRHLAERIPGCKARFFEGEGHLSLVRQYRDEILRALLE